jgi:hypothetical protein
MHLKFGKSPRVTNPSLTLLKFQRPHFQHRPQLSYGSQMTIKYE